MVAAAPQSACRYSTLRCSRYTGGLRVIHHTRAGAPQVDSRHSITRVQAVHRAMPGAPSCDVRRSIVRCQALHRALPGAPSSADRCSIAEALRRNGLRNKLRITASAPTSRSSAIPIFDGMRIDGRSHSRLTCLHGISARKTYSGFVHRRIEHRVCVFGRSPEHRHDFEHRRDFEHGREFDRQCGHRRPRRDGRQYRRRRSGRKLGNRASIEQRERRQCIDAAHIGGSLSE